MQTDRIIRYQGQIVREADAAAYMVSRGHTHELAMRFLAKCPTSTERPSEYRHFIANLNAANRAALEWNGRQQRKAELAAFA
jgi:hypothetical protein